MAKRWVPAASLVLALGLAAFAALLSVAWTIRDPALRARVVAHLASSSGLSVDKAGSMRLRLLPRPTLDIRDVRLAGLAGGVAIEADGLIGRLGLFGLLRGRLDIVTATIDEPTVVVDLDRIGPLATTILAGVPDGGEPSGTVAREPLRFLRTDGLTVQGGVLRLTSKDPQRDTLLTDVSATIDWPNGPGEASLSGTATWRGTPASVAIIVDAPGDLLSGRDSNGSLRLRSPVIDLTASGSIGLDGGLHGTGTLSATTADLAGFFKLAGTPLPQLSAFHIASLAGQATLSPDTLALADVALGLDDMSFEGAMVVQDAAGRPSLAGTLDTDRIDLNPFLAALPPLRDATGGWSEAALDAHAVADDDIDLRISASKAHIGALEFEDGSLSLQSGHGRMELSLGEARAYDGLLKGRVVATIDAAATDIRADFSMSRLDLTALAKDMPATSGLAGTATGHIMLEGQGHSYGDLLRALDGRGQVSIRNGAVGARLASDFVAVPPENPMPPMALLGRMAAFDSASIDFDVAQGAAAVRSGAILWPEAAATLAGSASIPRRSIDLTAALSPFADAATASPPIPLVFALTGPWSRLTLVAKDRGRAAAGPGER